MAYTQAQEAALQRARARLLGTEDEDKTSSLAERQWQAIRNARAALNTDEPTPTDDVGFWRGLGNAGVRGLSNLGSIPNASMAEDFSNLANLRAEQEAREAERTRTGEEPGLLERIATYRPSWAAPLETPEELRGLAADNAQAVAQRSVDAQENYPMTQAGAQAVQELSEADGFLDGLGTIVKNPLATASGIAQVAAEQLPTIVGAGLATAVTKNPKLGIGAFAGSGYSQERFGQLVPEASKQGYNLLDSRDALAAVSDTEFMQDQASRGATRGAIIGTVDLLTAGLASKAPLTLGGVGKQTGIQVVGGGGGEAAAQLATDGEIQAGEVIIEALAEGVSAPVDVAALGLRRRGPQGTELDSQEAQIRANEELELQASALADEKAAAVQAQAEVETTARVRREAATTFTPRKKFVADRLKVISQRLEADIRNPQTELGQAFEASINEQGIFDPADVETEAKAFLKGYQKETKAASEAQIAEEYVAALDSHAEAVARGDQPTVDLSTETQGDTATDAASQEAVAKPAKPPTKKEQLRALAVEQLGENFESDHPELSQLLSDGKGIYSRGSGKKSRFESMLGKAVAEQATEAQPTETQAQQPPTTVEQAAAPAAQEDVAAPPVVAEKAPEASEVLTGMDAQAETYAKEKLGDNWRESNPPLVELLNGKKYAGFQSNVDKVAQAQATLAPAAVEIKPAPVADVAQAQAPLAPAAVEIEPAPVADVAQQISDSDPTTTDPTTEIATLFAQPLPSEVKLSKNEQIVFDTMQQAFANNEQDAVIQSDGTLNPTLIAERGGLKSRQAAQTALVRLRPKLAKAYGLSQEQIKQRLAETKNKSTPGAEFDINAPTNEVDLAELGDSMGTVASANQGARDGMDDADVVYMEARSQEADQYANKRQEIADKERNKQLVGMVKTHGRDAISAWKNGVSVGGPNVDQLGKADLLEWISAVEEHKEGSIDDAQLAQDLRDIENKYDQNNAGPTLEDTNAGRTNESTATQIADDAGPSTGDATSAESGNPTEQVGTADTGESGRSSQEASTGVVGGVKTAPVVEVRKRKKIDPKKAKTSNPRFGVRDNATATASREAFEQSVNELTGDTQNVRIHVFDNEADALAAVESGDVPYADVAEIAKVQPYGWVQEDENGVPHAHFILDRIPAGGERAAFMHEVGGHVGIDNVLDEASRTKLASQIADWAGANDGSLESKLALRTLRRMDLAAMRGGVSDGVVVSEAIAYFLEEATMAGVDPTAGDAVGNFVQRIYDAFKAAFEALGLRNVDTLVAQDLVDMAYGAARFELMEGSLDPTTTTAPFQSPSYGVGRDATTKTEAARAYVKQNLGKGATKFFDDASFIARNAVDSTKFLHQFIRENKETMPSAGRWYNASLEAEKTRNDIRRGVESVAVQARDMKPERLEVVNDFIGSSTFYQKWGYDPEIEGRTVKVDPVMKRKFDRLAQKEQQLVKDIFAHGETMRLRKQEIAKNLGVEGKFFTDAALEGPYAPLKRFGNFVGQLKSQALLDAEAEMRENNTAETKKKVNDLKSDEANYVISFFDTMGAAKQFRDANKDKFATATASPRAPDMDNDRMSNPEAFDKILGQLRADDKSGIDSNAKAAFAEMVKKMYFQSLDERSARQSGARRMNRAGYEKNMIRSFLSHARAEAGLVANMEHGAEINTAFAEANVEAGRDEENLRGVYNMVAKHYRDTLVGKETPIQDRLAAMNSVYMLTTSVGYHVTNATQPAIVTVPRLAGDFKNYSGAWGALTRGYKVSVKAAKMGKNFEAEIDINKAPPKYRKLLEDLQLRQLLDVGMEEDLSEFDRFNSGYESINRATDALGKIVHKLYQVARFVEAHNRIAAAVAAYDMALANPATMKTLKMTPDEYATMVVEDTQGNFARFDAPYVVKFLPKMTTQYRKYQLMMGWAYGNAFNQAFVDKTISAEEKAMGKRVLGYTLTHAGIFAGATGIPLVTTLAPYALGWIEGEEEPQELERWIREKVESERLADVLSRGVFSAVGIDMSTKLSQGKIFHPFPYIDFEASEDGVKDVFFNALAGPSGTTALNFGRSAEYFKQGDALKGIEYMVPKGIRTLVESYRLGTEGFSAKSGDVLVDPRAFDMQSLLLNALGIPSTDVQKFKWTRGQQFELSEYVSNESSRIRREYIRAKDDGARGRMTELRDEWRDLQDQKERISPFFGSGREMRRQSVGDLIRAPRSQDRREQRAQRRFD